MLENRVVQYSCLWLIGAGGGFLVAGGVIALIVGLGIVTRYAGITKTTQHCKLYETAVLFGGLYGTYLTVYEKTVFYGRFMLMVQGLLAGMYVGAWIMALAEVVKMFPIFARRLGLTKGFSLIVISIAIGKVMGSTLQFYMNW